MADAAITTETATISSATQENVSIHPIPEFKFEQPPFHPEPLSTIEGRKTLTTYGEDAIRGLFVGNLVHRGATLKEVFTDNNYQEIVIIMNPNENPKMYQQFVEQIDFYLKYKDDPDFQKIAVPITKVFRDDQDKIIGMGQRYFGVALDEYLKNGFSLNLEKLNELTERYDRFIKKTGVVHEDLVQGYTNGRPVFDPGNIRFDPNNGEIRFIDYHGKGGELFFAKYSYMNRDDYLSSEAQRTKEAIIYSFTYSNFKSDSNMVKLASTESNPPRKGILARLFSE